MHIDPDVAAFLTEQVRNLVLLLDRRRIDHQSCYTHSRVDGKWRLSDHAVSASFRFEGEVHCKDRTCW